MVEISNKRQFTLRILKEFFNKGVIRYLPKLLPAVFFLPNIIPVAQAVVPTQPALPWERLNPDEYYKFKAPHPFGQIEVVYKNKNHLSEAWDDIYVEFNSKKFILENKDIGKIASPQKPIIHLPFNSSRIENFKLIIESEKTCLQREEKKQCKTLVYSIIFTIDGIKSSKLQEFNYP